MIISECECDDCKAVNDLIAKFVGIISEGAQTGHVQSALCSILGESLTYAAPEIKTRVLTDMVRLITSYHNDAATRVATVCTRH